MARTSSSIALRSSLVVWGGVLAAAVGVIPTHSRAQDLAGVFSHGQVSYEFIICSTCPRPTGVLFEGNDGGVGSHGPAIVEGVGPRGSGSGDVYARALLVGPLALPALDAQARVFPGLGEHEGLGGIGTYFFTANGSARAVQYFSHTGTLPQTYSFRYTLRGDAVNLTVPITPEGNAYLSASGGMAIHDGLNPDPERLYGGLVDVHQQFFNPDTSPFVEPGTVSILVNPGDSFYLLGFVAANAAAGGHGIAEASLSVELILGDPGTLVPVPELGSFWLLAAGLASLAWLRRRHS